MLESFRRQLTHNRHRGVVVVSGSWDWCLEQLEFLDGTNLWLGDNAPQRTICIQANQAKQWLGRECDQLILNGFDGLDLNALGALSGTVKAGGLCYLLCPEFESWLNRPDPQNEGFCVYPHDNSQGSNRWLQLLVSTIESNPQTVILRQNHPPQIPQLKSLTEALYQHPSYKTEQQQTAVEKIKKVATGHRRRPLVLTADRGRGKSSALGLALSELLIQGKSKVIITAPQVSSTTAVFERATERLDVIKQSPTQLTTSQGELIFVPPDELIRNIHTCDLLLVDEAAAIPAPMLTKILQNYSRIAFTSTIHGYEGTGRSFEIRFKQTLNRLTPNWQAYSMSQPIRYGQNDPLENFVNQVLMSNAQAADLSASELTDHKPLLKRWDRNDLLTEPNALSQIMGLLTLSHYKTAPNDLRHLLDGSNTQLYSFADKGKIVATALLAIEGDFPPDMAQAIWQGKRRPRGHLLAQTLGFHCGFEQAPRFKFARVVRIAVHPQVQHLGLGSEMLKQLFAACQQQGLDYLGSSFGAQAPLLRFWHCNGFTTVRLGITIDATSNEYSGVVLKPLSNPANTLLGQLKHQFQQQFSWSLSQFYQRLSVDVIIELLNRSDKDHLPGLSERDLLDISSYCNFNREYEFCAHALYRHTIRMITQSQTKQLDERQQALLINKVLRQHTWDQVAGELGYSGRKAAQQALKQIFSAFL